MTTGTAKSVFLDKLAVHVCLRHGRWYWGTIFLVGVFVNFKQFRDNVASKASAKLGAKGIV
jgi:hypothetical protein